MYAKLFTSLYQGTLRGNSHGLLVFTNLLAHCDRVGVVDVHPRAIAEEVGLTIDEVRAALAELEAVDPESRSPECDGRRIVRLDEHRSWGWTVVNYVKYRAIRDEQDRREQNRVSQERWRAKQRDDPPLTVSKISSVSRNKPMQKQKQKHTNTPPSPDGDAPPTASTKLARPEGVEPQTWSDWLTLRKAKKAPVTQTVVDRAEAESVKAGMTMEDFLKLWCARGSQGLLAAWIRPEEGKPTPTSRATLTEPIWRREKRETAQGFAGVAAKAGPGDVINMDMENLDAQPSRIGH